jgi:rhamnose utilization protein RhaD (predicted bifunctional aldolase and dehydrogenase)/NAD(P)-dependent dehydrogenase (short-subunit alcohol dehydrogenase family)
MESRYVEADAERFVRGVAAAGVSADVALRTYTARLLGHDAALVLHGGGNTSVKSRVASSRTGGEAVDVLYVKGSGWDLATIEPAGHPAVRLRSLLSLRARDTLSDEEMVNELRLELLDAAAPTPSVEALLHAFLPPKFIDHTHADAILALADQPDAARVCAGVFGDALVFVPYVMPGFALAKRCADAYEAVVRRGIEPSVMVLERHGLFTWGATARESYERTIVAVTQAERAVAARRRPGVVTATGARAVGAAERVLPIVRGALARAAGDAVETGPILVLDASDEALGFLARADAERLAATGPATPDHVLRTKPTALFLNDAAHDDAARLSSDLAAALDAYAARYDAYFADTCARKGAKKTKLDPWPRVILVPGVGACAVGATAEQARIVSDVYAHTMAIMSDAADIGAYAPVSRDDLFDVEYWSLEQAKLKPTTKLPMSGRVALVTGAASGIGLATATTFARLGAHLVLVDRDAPLLAEEAAKLANKHRARVAFSVADVTREADVVRAVGVAVETFGGLDVVVSNAGSATQGALETPSGDAALRASLEVNLLAHNLVVGAATRVFRLQGRGGVLLFNASKAAFNPGPGFGPYSVAKAALVGLMRQLAVDLAPYGVRVNAVNADRIRTRLFDGGVVESRAKARGLSVDAYFRSNLLGREVTADDVADAFAYLATARSTTGCVVTVDGGNAAAFPR